MSTRTPVSVLAVLDHAAATYVELRDDCDHNDNKRVGNSHERDRKQVRKAQAALEALFVAVGEVQADMGYLMGRASAEGHAAGQRLAKQTSNKLRAALAKVGAP